MLDKNDSGKFKLHVQNWRPQILLMRGIFFIFIFIYSNWRKILVSFFFWISISIPLDFFPGLETLQNRLRHRKHLSTIEGVFGGFDEPPKCPARIFVPVCFLFHALSFVSLYKLTPREKGIRPTSVLTLNSDNYILFRSLAVDAHAGHFCIQICREVQATSCP